MKACRKSLTKTGGIEYQIKTTGLETLPPLPPLPALVLRRLSNHGIDAHLHPLLVLMLEFDLPIHGREQRVIGGTPDILPRMKLRPALAHDDAARGDELSAEALHTEVFRIGVAPVARGADALLMSHAILSRPSRRRS